MTRSAPGFRVRTTTQSVVLSILVIALLVPTGLLFAQAWSNAGEKLSATRLEARGIDYLRSLKEVAFALADAQSAIVNGRPVPIDALTAAAQQVDATDARLGDSLRTHDRWSGIRTRIDGLRTSPPADQVQAIAAYREVDDLLLALFAKVRDQSGLVHDLDSDAFHLQNSVAAELPVALVAAGRLADTALLAQAAVAARTANPAAPPPSAEETLTLVSQLASERVTLVQASSRLVESLRSAVDATDSRTLGSNLLSRLDRFQIASETVAGMAGAVIQLSGAPAQQAGTNTGDPSRIVLARAEMRAAASELSITILNEVERLLDDRIAETERTRLIAVVATGVSLLIVAGAVALLLLGGRRHLPAPAPGLSITELAPGPRPTVGPPGPDDPPAPWTTVGPVTGAPYPAENNAQWERSGAR